MRPTHCLRALSSGALCLVLAALTISLMNVEGCVLDRAEIVAAPPATFSVLETRLCGDILCWRRYVVTDGQTKDYGTVCDTATKESPPRLKAK